MYKYHQSILNTVIVAIDMCIIVQGPLIVSILFLETIVCKLFFGKLLSIPGCKSVFIDKKNRFQRNNRKFHIFFLSYNKH